MSYAELLPYATPGMVAFGLGAIPAGWIANKWRRDGMMQVFFVGIGVASIACSFATTPTEMAIGLFAVGCSAAIYHPVGIAKVVQGRVKTGMPLAVNGVFGNLSVAAAPLLTGAILDLYDWKWAFIIPGVFSISTGIAYSIFSKAGDEESLYPTEGAANKGAAISIDRGVVVRVSAVIFLTTALDGIIFQSTTYALPKIFELRLQDMAASLTLIGFRLRHDRFRAIGRRTSRRKALDTDHLRLGHGNTGFAVRHHDQYVRRPGLDHFDRLHAGRVRANSDQ